MDNNYQQPPVPQYGAPIPPQQPIPQQPQKNGLAVASLILGIVSVTCCFCTYGVAGIIGLILGIVGKKQKPGVKSGLATVGIILSIIGLVLAVIFIVAAPSIVEVLAKSIPEEMRSMYPYNQPPYTQYY